MVTCSLFTIIQCILDTAVHFVYWLMHLLAQELKRLVAYARSSANLLTRLVLQDQTDSYRWEVSDSLVPFTSPASWIISAQCFGIWIVMDLLFASQCLFRTPLNNYDAIILLHGDRLPYPRRLLFPSKISQGIVTRCRRLATIWFLLLPF